MTVKRWELLKAMTGQGEMSIREAARQVERDVKAVHSDVQALLKAGVLEHTADGHIVFPYEAVHVDFTLHVAQLVRNIDGIRRIKAKNGADLIVQGSSTLTPLLLEHDLADEVLLLVYPILLPAANDALSVV